MKIEEVGAMSEARWRQMLRLEALKVAMECRSAAMTAGDLVLSAHTLEDYIVGPAAVAAVNQKPGAGFTGAPAQREHAKGK